MCLWPQRGAFSGYYTPKRSHLKIAVLPQCETFSADFAGKRSICALRRAKITEGGFCAQTLAGAVFQRNIATPQLKLCRG